MKFKSKSVPVKIAAKVYGKDPAWVRAGIVSGYLPIGVATRNGIQVTDVSKIDRKYGRINFYISPKKLYEHTGYIWRDEMTTSIRPDISKNNKYWISKHRYYELKHFCLQYHEWEKTILYLEDRSRTSSLIKPGKINESIDSTGDLGTSITYLKDKMELVKHVCMETDSSIGSYIFKAVTDGVSFENLKAMHGIPCGRDMYYDRYRKFFWLLDKEI